MQYYQIPSYWDRAVRETVPSRNSGIVAVLGVSQLAMDASPTGVASQAPSGAALVEHAQERRQALDGEWYTMEEFMQYY